ncbi:unnamed protein product [Rotaria magnacalcarata]|uniref:PiggyBac transposable element-derived protein domain-containing protein n=2 Tax=Rotaria magnacalcarata TaxID=392030 RepID=A0A816FIE0_9BILA|nr:unnamed protein product [Rotaria magnacalcarata]CAF5213027.1 unnamed protein product [Rotaria magnacalcarata]
MLLIVCLHCIVVNRLIRCNDGHRKKKKHVLIARPNVTKAYNKHMGGVDLVDMLISLYRINVRSKKYYIKIIFHLIDLSVVNAWLLYRRHCSQLKVPKKNVMPLLAFRINVPSVLLKSSPPPPSIIKCGRPSLESRAKSNENQSTNTLRTAPTPIPPSSTRLGKVDHWPIATSKGRCRNPGLSGYTRVSCSKCDQRLCLNEKNNCFKDYHN